MGRTPSRVLVLGVGVTIGLAACSGGGDSGSIPRRDVPRNAPEPTTTSAAPARIDLSQPIPGGSLHGTPRPPLENTGTDYVAILTSLIANFRWLTENPDPRVISDLYVPGSEDHTQWVKAFEELVSKQWRAADDEYHVISARLVDEQPGVASLEIVDYLGLERILDSSGEQVGEGRERVPPERMGLVLIAVDEVGRWRIADWVTPEDAEVAL